MKKESILDNVKVLTFIALAKKLNLNNFNLYKELKKFIYSNTFTKDQTIEIFQYFSLSKLDALEVYVTKIFYLCHIKVGNIKKLKNCFTIFMFIFDHLYKNDVIDCHLKINIDSNINQYYDFIPKVTILKGWCGLRLTELLGTSFTLDLLYHLKNNSRFFCKIGVFTDEVKSILIKIINLKDIFDNNSLPELQSLIMDLRFKANLSLIHICEIITSRIIFIIDLDFNLHWDSSKDKIVLDYYENHPDKKVRDFHYASKKYHDNFLENYELYQKDYTAFLYKFNVFKKESVYDIKKNPTIFTTILNNIKIFIKNSFYNNNYNYAYDKKLENYILSIDSQYKQKVYLIHYNFSNKNMILFFNKIVSEYNFRWYTNKKKYYKAQKKSVYIQDDYDKAEEEDGYLLFDLTRLTKSNFEELSALNKLLIENKEKKINDLLKEDSSELISLTIFDSFNHLSFFYNFLKNYDITSDDMCDLFNSNKYK